MSNIEIVHESNPEPRLSGKGGVGMHMMVRLVDSTTGKLVSSHYAEGRRNERVPREERKY